MMLHRMCPQSATEVPFHCYLWVGISIVLHRKYLLRDVDGAGIFNDVTQEVPLHHYC